MGYGEYEAQQAKLGTGNAAPIGNAAPNGQEGNPRVIEGHGDHIATGYPKVEPYREKAGYEGVQHIPNPNAYHEGYTQPAPAMQYPAGPPPQVVYQQSHSADVASSGCIGCCLGCFAATLCCCCCL